MTAQQARMYKRALAAYPTMAYPGIKTQWEDCFTTEGEVLILWFNTPMGNTRVLTERKELDLYSSYARHEDCPNCGAEESIEVPANCDDRTPVTCSECGVRCLAEYDGDYDGDHWQGSVSLRATTGAVPGKEGERT